MHDEEYGLCECGCGQKTEPCPGTIRSIGWVKGEPKRFIHGHQSRKPGPKYEERDLGHTSPCWIWLRSVDHHNYGKMRWGPGCMKMAHRVYYEQAKGPIPEGLQLDHLCRNRRCVNPDHLEPVTGAENQRRGRKTKLTIEQVRDIRERPKFYGSALALAAEFGVTPATITGIRNRTRNWKDA